MLRRANDILLDVASVGLALPYRVQQAARSLRLLSPVQIPETPFFPPAALAKWKEEVSKSNVYLEYGSGGSTVEASQFANHVITVETDAIFLKGLKAKIAKRADFHPVYVNIGITRAWGIPAVTLKTRSRLKSWKRYSSAPWNILERANLLPDLILIDGRFRVASTLESLMRLPEGAPSKILLDDFVGREHLYSPVLIFADDISFFDRMVSFRKSATFDQQYCGHLLEKFQSDWH